MLALAETKNIYRDLRQSDLAQPIPAQPSEHANVTAVRERGPHLPKIGLEAIVYVLRKLP